MAPRNARRRLHERVGGGVETSSSSVMDSDARAALRRANSRKMRSSSSDAATSTDVEAPSRPVSPRRISDPICQHSDSQVDVDDGPGTSIPYTPPVAPPSARVPPRSMVTTVQMHPEPRLGLTAVPMVAGIETVPLLPAYGQCLPGELFPETESGGIPSSHRPYWRLPLSTPTARREVIVELQQQRSGTSSSLVSLHHQRSISSIAPQSPPPAALGPRPLPAQGEPGGWRGVVPGHLLYRRPAACRSETASPVVDDDDDDGVGVTSSARDRQLQTSWHVRRHLKAISERSQSSDTIYA